MEQYTLGRPPDLITMLRGKSFSTSPFITKNNLETLQQANTDTTLEDTELCKRQIKTLEEILKHPSILDEKDIQHKITGYRTLDKAGNLVILENDVLINMDPRQVIEDFEYPDENDDTPIPLG